jgi:hypothetical protein
MQDIRLECTFDSAEYKEYKVLIGDRPLGVISWANQSSTSEGSWYLTASDGQVRHFQTQQAAIDFLNGNSSKSTSEISVRLKIEAKKLTDIAEDLESESIDL